MEDSLKMYHYTGNLKDTTANKNNIITFLMPKKGKWVEAQEIRNYTGFSDVNKTLLKWTKTDPNLNTKLEKRKNFPFRIRYYKLT